jgi:hypothetical protein
VRNRWCEFISNPDGHHHPDHYGRSIHLMGNNLVVHIDGGEAVVNSYSLNFFEAPDGEIVYRMAPITNGRSWIEDRWMFKERRRRQVGDPLYISKLDAMPE